MNKQTYQKPRTKVSVLLLPLLPDFGQNFATRLIIFIGLSKLLPVFLLGTENDMGATMMMMTIQKYKNTKAKDDDDKKHKNTKDDDDNNNTKNTKTQKMVITKSQKKTQKHKK